MTEGNSSFFSIHDFNSTKHSTNPLDTVFSARRLFHVAALAEHFYTPLLCLVGAIGNLLSLAVFCFNANQRGHSSSYYLSALAISDTGFLLSVFVFWLETLGTGLLSSNLFCPLTMYTGQVTCFLSVYLTVAFTIERFYAVCKPLKRSSVCTVSRAKKVIFCLTLFALIAFSYVLVIAQVVDIANIRRTGEDYEMRGNDNGSIPSDSSQSQGGNGAVLDVMQYHLSTVPSMNEVDTIDEKGWELYDGESSGDRLPLPKVTLNEDGIKDGILSTDMFNSTILINLNNNDSNGDPAHTLDWRCTVPIKYIPVSIIANYFDSVITLLVPFGLIAYFNTRIALCVWKLKDERKKIVAGTITNKFRETSLTPHESHGVRTYFRRLVGQRRKSRKERDQELRPGQFYQQECDDPVGSSNPNIIHGPAETQGPDRIDEGHFSKDNEVSDAGCKSSLSKCPPKVPGSSPSSTPNRRTRVEEIAGGESGNHTFPSKRHGSPTSDLNHEVSPSTPRLKPVISMRKDRFGNEGNVRTRNTPASSTSSSEARVTKMLLLVSTAFLILNLPSHAIRLLTFFQTMLWGEDMEVVWRLNAAQQISDVLLFNSNFAVNFFLYCLSGRNFRKSLWDVLFGRCQKNSKHRVSKPNANTTIVRKNIRFTPEEGNSGIEERRNESKRIKNGKGKNIPVKRNVRESELIELENTMSCNLE